MRNTKIGIIGGGQLGMLLVQSAIQFPCHTAVYDPNPNCSAASFTAEFTKGSFSDTEAIIQFGQKCDVLIYETESVDLEALKTLEAQGKKVLSAVHTLEWIQSKATQRQKLTEHGFPIPEFSLVPGAEVKNYSGPFPIVQKWAVGGYDGQGVHIHRNAESLAQAKEVDSVFEQLVDLKMELSLLIARDHNGNIAVYPPIELVFNEVNLVDYLIAPARISPELNERINALGRELAEKLDFIGIYAIELFLDQQDQIFVNEISPRPHNSGHHTVSANVTSQYEQQIRIALDLPLGSVEMISPCVMLNLIGATEETASSLNRAATGPTDYVGLKEAYKIPNVQYYFYGKDQSRPNRKMAHALILEQDLETALNTVKTIRNTLTITSHEQ